MSPLKCAQTNPKKRLFGMNPRELSDVERVYDLFITTYRERPAVGLKRLNAARMNKHGPLHFCCSREMPSSIGLNLARKADLSHKSAVANLDER